MNEPSSMAHGWCVRQRIIRTASASTRLRILPGIAGRLRSPSRMWLRRNGEGRRASFDGLIDSLLRPRHRPDHVHVIGSGSEAVFNLNCPAGPAELRENYGFPRRETSYIRKVLTKHLEEFCRAWEEIHGGGRRL